MPDIDGITRCSWCEASLYPDDPDFASCPITGEAHYGCHEEMCPWCDPPRFRAPGADTEMSNPVYPRTRRVSGLPFPARR